MTHLVVLMACALLVGSGGQTGALSPTERDLLAFLSRTDEGRDGRVFVPRQAVGFARFCDFPRERRELFEGLAYVRMRQEDYNRLILSFQRECGVQLRRDRENAWTVIRRLAPGERLPRHLAREGVRVTIVASGATTE
jgi:hypothetical protein